MTELPPSQTEHIVPSMTRRQKADQLAMSIGFSNANQFLDFAKTHSLSKHPRFEDRQIGIMLKIIGDPTADFFLSNPHSSRFFDLRDIVGTARMQIAAEEPTKVADFINAEDVKLLVVNTPLKTLIKMVFDILCRARDNYIVLDGDYFAVLEHLKALRSDMKKVSALSRTNKV